MLSTIHPTSLVSKDAIIGDNVNIGAYAIIEEDVQIGEGTKIGSHAIIKAHTYLGKNNIIHDHAMLGNVPQDINFDKNKVTYLIIGDGNEFREFCNVHRSAIDGGKTIIKNNCYIMACGHIGHDCVIENNVVVCNGALLAGYVQVGRNAFISGNTTVHQFCHIGAFAMLGGLTRVPQDILPYSLVADTTGTVYKLNIVGMKRGGLTSEQIAEAEHAHNMWYNWSSIKAEFVERYENDDTLSDIAKEIVQFIINSKRGITPRHI